MGLGPLHTISLAEARARALAVRKQLLEGIDPLDARHNARLAQQASQAKAKTFNQCAAAYIEAHRAGWKNSKHADQWESTLNTYVEPIFGSLPIAEIDTGLVMKALEPIWTTKTETASRVRGRIESILDWATVRGYRAGENPARWKGHLDKLLPKRSKVQRVEHHPALPYAEAPKFVKCLRGHQSIGALAFQFLIFTATRTNETVNARWDEIDMDKRLWTIPASRMKMEKEHRIPLSDAAMEILKSMSETGERKKATEGEDNGFVFPGQREGRPLSNMAFLQILKRLERTDITPHGFRSTFRDWAGEKTHYPREVMEAALAHSIKDKSEAAYARGDLFAKRKKLMQAWSQYLTQ